MRRKRAGFLFLLLVILFVAGGCAKKEEGDAFDFSGIEPKDLNPWTYVEDTLRNCRLTWKNRIV